MSARVLVVDDILPNVKLLQIKLTKEYYNVVTAMSGEEALKKVQEELPDIVLLDVMMPGMDGNQVCEILKSDPATMNIPVIMVTALSDVSDRVRGLEAGADDFLSKPINDVALFARVRSLLRLKMTFDQWRLRETTRDQLGVVSADEPTMLAQETTGARLLVVEDNEPDLARIRDALAADNNEIVAVGDGEAAQAHLDQDFDVIMVSISLSGSDGLRLCSQFRADERTRQIPLLMLADDGDTDRMAKGLELGANDYIVRPIDINELLARVRSQVRRKRYQDSLLNAYRENMSAALIDSLTGLYNRRYLDAHTARLVDEAITMNKSFAVLTLDIDHFKRVNDTYGHDVGDQVLVKFAQILRDSIRSFDLVARTGGEEFVIILPETGAEIAMRIGERLRAIVEASLFEVSTAEGGLRVTTSVGAAEFAPADSNFEAVFKRADSALYEAKRAGRNQVKLGQAAIESAPASVALGG